MIFSGLEDLFITHPECQYLSLNAGNIKVSSLQFISGFSTAQSKGMQGFWENRCRRSTPTDKTSRRPGNTMPSSKDVLGTSAASPYDDASAARYTQKKTDTGNGGALRRSCRRARSDGPSRNGRGGSAEEEGGRDSRPSGCKHIRECWRSPPAARKSPL